MVLKRKSAAKLASLSALGAGALVMGAQKAEASVILSGTINAKVGFDSGFSASFTSPALGAGGPNFKFSRASSNRTTASGGLHQHFRKDLFNQIGGVNFATQSGILELFAAGATFGQRSGNQLNGLVADRFSQLATHTILQGHAFTNEYALIHFGPGAGLYGWVDLTLAITGSTGPDLTIISYAYDDSGAILAAGATTNGGASTPEPATFATTGLAALALGAVGIRRWRKTRTAA